MKMKYLYHDAEGNAVVTMDEELVQLLTSQSSKCIMKPNEELRLYEHVTKFKTVYQKYNKIKEHFSKFFAALMED